MPARSRLPLAAIAPGIMVAATGVGAGDLLTASLAGSQVGLALLWAAVLGGVLKFVLNEGIARWQMATDTTLLEGWIEKLGAWIQWLFLAYLLIWSIVVAGALINASGVAGTGLMRIGDTGTSKVVWGVIHSIAGLVLVRMGGFRVFEISMCTCIAIMFGATVLTAILIQPDWPAVMRGVLLPSVPRGSAAWLLGVLGGVGGTLTLLSYGYWIREEGRRGRAGLRACRLDLLLGYAMTVLFGVSMIVIGSRVELEGRGAEISLVLADQLATVAGSVGRWVFLVGFWGAVFSSLLGVWQSVPYLFADFLMLRRGLSIDQRRRIDYKTTRAYKAYQLGLAIGPIFLLRLRVEEIQLTYAVLGAMFMPLLALTLLLMNNRVAWVGRGFRSGWATNAVLVATLLLFAYVGGAEIVEAL